MEKTTQIFAQVYGYAVCLVLIITFIISATALVTAIFDLADPLHSGWAQNGSPSLASYGNYKLDILRSLDKVPDNDKASYISDEQTLRSMYEAAKNDKIQSVNHQAGKSAFSSVIIIFICITLFILHWKWIQRIIRPESENHKAAYS